MNWTNLREIIYHGYLPHPKMVIPPERTDHLWPNDRVPEPRASGETLDYMLFRAVSASVKGLDSVAVWLSGGIDSTTLLWYLTHIIEPSRIHAYTADFGAFPDELEGAEMVTRSLGVRWTMYKMRLEDHLGLLETSIQNSRGPLDFATQVTRAAELTWGDGHAVVLSALGLDELLAGYPEHINCSDTDFPQVEKHLLEKCRDHYVYQNTCQHPFLDVRFPWLNTEIVSYCRALPLDQKRGGVETKVSLRRLMRGRLPDPVVDAGHTAGTKRGFGPPIGEWLDAGLEKWIKEQERELPLRLHFMGHLNRWQRLRRATVPTFLRLNAGGAFDE